MLRARRGRILHGTSLDEGEVRIPLIMTWPDGSRRGEVVEHPVPGRPMHGRSLLDSPARPILLELVSAPGERWLACRSGRYKLVINPAGERRMYDAVADPAEIRDLTATHENEARQVEADLWRAVADSRRDAPGRLEHSADDLERELRKLGYLGR